MATNDHTITMSTGMFMDLARWADSQHLQLISSGRNDGAFHLERTPANEAARRVGLSPRQEQILELIARGLDTNAIGRELFLGTETIRSHVRGITAKLGVHDRASAVHRAWELGILRRAA
jgi:DNA-binding NarL/FixJ family response regulator